VSCRTTRQSTWPPCPIERRSAAPKRQADAADGADAEFETSIWGTMSTCERCSCDVFSQSLVDYHDIEIHGEHDERKFGFHY
jgi:hypothetical protein